MCRYFPAWAEMEFAHTSNAVPGCSRTSHRSRDTRRLSWRASRSIAGMSLAGGRSRNRVGDVRAGNVVFRHIGMIEIEIVLTRHAEPFHQPPASRIAARGDGDDAVTGQIVPGPIQSRARGFAGDALSPGVLAQPPANFDLALDRARRADFSPQNPKIAESARRSMIQKQNPFSAWEAIARAQRACASSGVTTPPRNSMTAGVLVTRMNSGTSDSAMGGG